MTRHSETSATPAANTPTRADPMADVPAGTVFVYADGASRGNPGPAGAGWVLCRAEGEPFAEGCLYLGRHTNNEAEYAAATLGLQAALELGCGDVVLRADSELMVRQLTGVYRVRNARLLPLYETLAALSRKFPRFGAEHVRRERNALADAQANLAIDEARQRGAL